MDNTIIQEASASEHNMNGDTDATPECAADVPATTAGEDAPAADATAATEQQPAKSYDDLFPSLPTSGRNPAAGGGGPAPIGGGQWNRKPVLASSTVTQVSLLLVPTCTRW